MYLEIADEIERRIRAGELKPGDRVPSTRRITAEWGVAIATATKALTELGTRGLVRPVPGVGTVVTARTEAPVPTAKPRAVAPTRARIIHHAIALADAEGIAAVSMRRLAVELGLATMSLYRWVPGKDELLVGMMDAVMGAGAWPTAPPRGWRAQLEYVARRQWREYTEHPWLAHVVSLTRPQLAPSAMRHTEWVLRAIAGYDLDDTTRLFIVLTLFGYVKGAATGLDAERQAEQDTGLDIEEWIREHDTRFTPVIGSGRYPHLAKLEANGDVDMDLTRLFEFGLARLLDGFAVLLDGPRGRRR
jgi:DNA-binding transcriptional regulator YhcF (GntR family)